MLPLTAVDYEEVGYPGDIIDDFHAIPECSPYDNIPKDVLYPAVLVTSSFNTRLSIQHSLDFLLSHLSDLVYGKLGNGLQEFVTIHSMTRNALSYST
ncbi:hypothetical protein YC2023_084232 [Brassica napus]